LIVMATGFSTPSFFCTYTLTIFLVQMCRLRGCVYWICDGSMHRPIRELFVRGLVE
jgi:hypothetical protein